MSDAILQIERQSVSLRVQVWEKLRHAIVQGRFKPGDRLVEKELCRLVGVGRTSIREALRQLEAEGLVTSHPHRGLSVTMISYDEARQLYKVRAILEAFAGQLFAERGTDPEIRNINAAVEHFEEAIAQNDAALLTSSKNAFYDCLMTGSGNVFAKQMLTGLHNRINLLRITSMTQPGRLAHSLAELKEISLAITERDGPRANAACRHHIEEAARVALEYLRRESTSLAHKE